MMTVNFRNIFKQSSIYGFFSILTKSVGLLLLPLYTRYLRPDQYGILELVEITAAIFGSIAGSGLSFSIFKFYHKYHTKEEQNCVIASAIICSLCLHSCLASLGLIFSGSLSNLIFESPNYRIFFILIFVRVIFAGTINIGVNYIRLLNRAQLFGWLSLTRFLCSIALNILFIVFLGMGVIGILLSSLITQIVIGLPLIFCIYRQIGFHFDISKVLDMIKYGAPFIGVVIGQLLINYADRFYLQRFTTLTDVGIYSLGYKFGFMVNFLVLTPFLLMWEGKMFEVEKLSNAKNIYSRVLTYLMFALVLVALVLILFKKEILTVMVAPDYYSAAVIVPLIAIAYIFNGLQTFFRLGMLIRSKTSIIGATVIVQGVFSLGVYSIAIRLWGSLGAAVATLLSFSGVFIVNYLFSQRLYRIPIEGLRLVRIVTGASFILIIKGFLPNLSLIFALLANCGLIILFLFFLFITGFLDDREKLFLNQAMVKFNGCVPLSRFYFGESQKVVRD